jgi:hypothetical protein
LSSGKFCFSRFPDVAHLIYRQFVIQWVASSSSDPIFTSFLRHPVKVSMWLDFSSNLHGGAQMKKVLIILATIAGVIALGNVLIAGAQTGSRRFSLPMGSMMTNTTGIYTGTMPYGRMMHGGNYTGTLSLPFGGQMHTQMAQLQQKVLDALSAKLNMTSGDLLTALQNGQTLTDLAKAKNLSLSDLQAVANAARQTALADLVQQNVIRQAQADLMLAHMQDMQILGFGGMHGFDMHGHLPGGMPNGGRHGRGMMHGFPGGQPQQPPVTTPSTQG